MLSISIHGLHRFRTVPKIKYPNPNLPMSRLHRNHRFVATKSFVRVLISFTSVRQRSRKNRLHCQKSQLWMPIRMMMMSGVKVLLVDVVLQISRDCIFISRKRLVTQKLVIVGSLGVVTAKSMPLPFTLLKDLDSISLKDYYFSSESRPNKVFRR